MARLDVTEALIEGTVEYKVLNGIKTKLAADSTIDQYINEYASESKMDRIFFDYGVFIPDGQLPAIGITLETGSGKFRGFTGTSPARDEDMTIKIETVVKGFNTDDIFKSNFLSKLPIEKAIKDIHETELTNHFSVSEITWVSPEFKINYKPALNATQQLITIMEYTFDLLTEV